MNVLFIGDVVGEAGCATLRRRLLDLKRKYFIDLTIANGENSAVGNGISKPSCEYLFDSGVDVLTGGNHSLRKKGIFNELNHNPNLLRPANLPQKSPGKGLCVFDLGKYKAAILNLIGQVYMPPSNSPFEKADELLENLDAKIIIVDIHAEATGEKGALGYYLDGRVSAVLGTHTHVQTNDAKILPKGTGFISDVGMTGPYDSILGVSPQNIVDRMTTLTPVYFTVKNTPCMLNGAVIKIDESTGKCTDIFTVNIKPEKGEW